MPLDRLRWPLAAALALAGVALAAWFLSGRGSRNDAIEVRYDAAEVKVYVAGAVRQPGVYSLWDGARVVDAVAAAGGFADGADQLAVNLAQRVRDEDRVIVPRQGDPPPVSSSASPVAGSGELIDLNSAPADLLDTLPGIGPVYAQRIIDSRASQPFASPDDLLSRKLIPRSTFDKIRPLVTVGP